MDPELFAAILSVNSLTDASSSARGTDLFASPHSAACLPVNVSAVNDSSFALREPTNVGQPGRHAPGGTQSEFRVRIAQFRFIRDPDQSRR